MRWAKSYSIVDHGLLHGGYFHRLSHEAPSLYLFLVVVGDRDGKSYYFCVAIRYWTLRPQWVKVGECSASKKLTRIALR